MISKSTDNQNSRSVIYFIYTLLCLGAFQDCNVDSDLYQITCNTTEDSQKTLTENPSEKLKVLAPPARVRDVREGPRSQSLAVTLVPRADSVSVKCSHPGSPTSKSSDGLARIEALL